MMDSIEPSTISSAEEKMMNPVKFLVCVDNSPESLAALRFACIKAKKRGGLVDILHILQPADFQTLSSIADKMRAERRQEAENMLQKLAEEAHKLDVTVSILLREGGTGDEILAAALEDYDANMMVLGVAPKTTNRGKLISWLASQLGDKLLIPLMLVPGNLTDQQMEELS